MRLIARILGAALLVAIVLFVGFDIFEAQQTAPEPVDGAELAAAREQTGGTSTLEDILARQRGQDVPRPERSGSAEEQAAQVQGILGARGSDSDARVWEEIRYGTAPDLNVSARGPAAGVLIQDGGMWWQQFRQGPLAHVGGLALLVTIGVLLSFYLIRGRIRVHGGLSGIRILRFSFIERFAHWMLAVSFLLLAFTGLITLFGRDGLIPIVGHETYAALAVGSKWVHNNVSWAFMLALVLVFLFWVFQNLPSRTDLKWLAAGGGFFGDSHPPAKKFNAGQKLIFWSVIIFGASISASGLSLLFPFEIPMFAKTFGILNDTGAPQWLGFGTLPDQMTPQEEMQYAQLWHAIVGFVLMAIVIAHIYIGSLGMQGAFDAMGKGHVDLAWAKEHHSLWVEEMDVQKKRRLAAEDGAGTATPAE